MYEMSAPLGFLDAKKERSWDVQAQRWTAVQAHRQACSWHGHAIVEEEPAARASIPVT